MSTYDKVTDFTKFNLANIGVKPKEKNLLSPISGSIDSDNVLLLQTCANYWDALSDFRARRKRSYKNFGVF